MPDSENKNLPGGGEAEHERGGREYSRRVKRIILLSFAGMLLFVALFFAGSYLIGKYGDAIGEDNDYNPTPKTITFFTPDYGEDIYKDKYYMGLDRQIYYSDIGTGLTVAVTEDDYLSYGEVVRFMYDYVNFIIAGDAESYNECFSFDYYLTDGNEEKEAFTMQKLYNIKFTKISETSDDAGADKYVYTLEYMIYQNNGTFRTDMESDASRTQYLVITDRRGELLIDLVSNVVIR